MESIFKHLDYKKTGKVAIEDLVDACNKLASEEIDKHELRVPQGEDLNRIYNTMKVQEEGKLNYDEFQILSFKSITEID